jgi:MoaA/NifB/PqqE/SkfB family radical SAM enzyme
MLFDLRAWLGRIPVYLTGGEALLVPFTPDLVAYGSRLGLFIELLTHGYWDDQSRIERLAAAKPGRVTISLDGIGGTHTSIRGRENFFEKTTTTIRTLQRVRSERNLDFTIRLKCVIMSHNLDDAVNVAEYANQPGMDVFFQPIEQNYNTPENSQWFQQSANWPKDTERAVDTVQQLIALKRKGLPIANSFAQLDVMIPYFRNPDSMRVATTMHIAHEHRPICSALTNIQVLPNGDVTTCYRMQPVGNIKTHPIRDVWDGRPHWWTSGCCLLQRCSASEKKTLSLVELS